MTEREVLDLLWARLSRIVNGASVRYVMAEHVRYDPGVVRPDELPHGWGLILADRGHTRCTVRSPRQHDPVPLAPRQIASIMRAVQQTAQHHARRERITTP